MSCNIVSDENSVVRYKLSDDEVLRIYYDEPRLAALMNLDVLCYIDNHLVVNLGEFLTPKTKHLSAYAKKNLSSCCVGIMIQNRNRAQSTLDMLLQASGFVEKGSSIDGKQSDEELNREATKIDAEIGRINKVLGELPGSFSGSLKKHMKRLGYTEELLATESWVSLSTIKQYRQKEEKEKTLKTVTALCIGMHLHPWFAEDLLRKAGIVPKATKLDGAYRFLYTFHYKDTIEECNKYLKSQRLPEFTLRDKTA